MPSFRIFRRFSLLLPALLVAAAFLSLPSSASIEADDAPLRVLLLSKSSGYEHSVIKRTDGKPSHVETVLGGMAGDNGFELEVTKDAGLINQKNLANYDVVIFFTTGNLFESGGDKSKGIFSGDGEPPMGKDGLKDLLAWIEGGGGFMGFHCATDTFKSSDLGLEKDAVTDYVEMIGGEFKTHGQQFVGTVKVVDGKHPVAAHLKDGWQMKDEWYMFQKENPDRQVIAKLDPGPARKEQPKVYDVADYPVIWTRSIGEGRVYYNAMGHREEVWLDEMFQQVVMDGIRWSGGR